MPYTARSNEPYGFARKKGRYGRRKGPILPRILAFLVCLAIVGHVAYVAAIRDWVLTWGATPGEVSMRLPGDNIVSRPMSESTRAVTINAPRGRVWPWLVQMGQEKGGLYSYESLENLVGCKMVNADRIVPAFQDTKTGDRVRLGPEGYPSYRVNAMDKPKAFVLEADSKDETKGSWAFVLHETPSGKTRLIIRTRGSWEPGFAMDLMWAVTERVSFVMERKMLLTIKALAESDSHR